MYKKLPMLWRLFLSFMFIVTLNSYSSVFAQESFSLVVHNIQVNSDSAREIYNVNVFVSALNDLGYPIQNLDISNFTLFEDSQSIMIADVGRASDVPVSLILVIDTSESMSMDGLVKAKRAASKFLQKLSANDQVAIVGFNTIVDPMGRFTNIQSAQDQLNDLKSVYGSGSCLYDAAYKSMELATTLPPGRRAIILLTDGKDETADGRNCSSFTAEDVITLANGNSGNIPLYTIGLGKNVDESVLKRMSDLTGGEYLLSPDTLQLDTLFEKLNQQIKGQYHLRYISTGLPGPHKITVEVSIGAEKAQSTRAFWLPNLPTGIRIVSPEAGQTYSGQVEIATRIIGEKENINSVRFDVAGQTVSIAINEPYSLVLDLSKFPEGNLDISAIVQDRDNNELARDSINIIASTGEASIATPSLQPPVVENETQIVLSNIPTLLISALAGIILLVGLILFFTFRKKNEPVPLSWDGDSAHIEPTLVGYDMDIGKTEDAPATLTVLFSDDANLIGKKFTLREQLTKIGRDKTVNNIAFENDRPVSREHVTITVNNQGLFVLEEVLHRKSVEMIGPTYGTFVNENRITKAITIFDGDQLRLGNRLKLLFEASRKEQYLGDATIDDIEPVSEIINKVDSGMKNSNDHE
jgi:VWFA-related protein